MQLLIDVTVQVAEVREYMRFRKVPYELQLRVLRYYDYMYQKKFFDEKRIIFAPNMSPILRQVREMLQISIEILTRYLQHCVSSQELMMHNCKDLVLKVKFLSNAKKRAIADLVQEMNFLIFFPGDHIIEAGQC